jgi:hypothetical protein
MLSDPANRSNRFLLRLSWSLGLTGAILPCSYRLSFANCGSRSPDEAEIGPVFVF